jgi:hypothetical protein
MSTEKREGGFGVNGILGSDQCTGMITIKFNNAYVSGIVPWGSALLGVALRRGAGQAWTW